MTPVFTKVMQGLFRLNKPPNMSYIHASNQCYIFSIEQATRVMLFLLVHMILQSFRYRFHDMRHSTSECTAKPNVWLISYVPINGNVNVHAEDI